jgi:hypothetical protein
MKLPEGSILEIAENKIKDYLLNPNHPDGKSKAEFFIANGINLESIELFEELLKQQASVCEIAKIITTFYGIKYVFESSIKFPTGKSHNIRSVWIAGQNQKKVKFVTAYKI